VDRQPAEAPGLLARTVRESPSADARLHALWTLEGLGKVSIGRSRPGGMRLGFPSGHTAAAAAFYPMACYFFEDVVRRWVKYALYALAAVLIVLVALSRMVLRVHWPLDVVGGAVLGVTIALLLLAIARRRSVRLRRAG